MCAGISCVIFEPLRVFENLSNQRVFIARSTQRRLAVDRLLKCDVHFAGNKIRQSLRFGNGNAHRACHILDRGFRLQSTKGNDLRNMSIFLTHIIQDNASTILANINVDIGILASIWIRETLEEQSIFFRACIGQTQYISHHCANARATCRCWNAPLPSPTDKVPHDQKVCTD